MKKNSENETIVLKTIVFERGETKLGRKNETIVFKTIVLENYSLKKFVFKNRKFIV